MSYYTSRSEIIESNSESESETVDVLVVVPPVRELQVSEDALHLSEDSHHLLCVRSNRNA